MVFAADDAPYLEKVVCVTHKEEGRVPLVPIDDESATEFALDLDKAKSDLSAATVQHRYSIPGVEARVYYSLRYVPAAAEKAEYIALSTAFFRKSKPRINVKPRAPQKKGKNSRQKAAPESTPEAAQQTAPADSWEMIPGFISQGEITFPMIPGQINPFGSPEVDIVPPLEVECKLKRERVKQDCPTCR